MGNLSAIYAQILTNLGQRADAASATGSLHAKVKDIKDNPATVINSIQRGTVATDAGGGGTATITSVTVAKSLLSYLGLRTTTNNVTYLMYVVLTSATVITASGGGGPATASWEVVEYK
mgnify:CR=1 FL=1